MSTKRRFATVFIAAATASSIATAPAVADSKTVSQSLISIDKAIAKLEQKAVEFSTKKTSQLSSSFGDTTQKATSTTDLTTAPAMETEGSNNAFDSVNDALGKVNGSINDQARNLGSTSGSSLRNGTTQGSAQGSIEDSDTIKDLNKKIYKDNAGKATELSGNIANLAGAIVPLVAIAAAISAGVYFAKQQGFIR